MVIVMLMYILFCSFVNHIDKTIPTINLNEQKKNKRKENWEQTNYYLADVLHTYQIQRRDVCCLVLMHSSKTISV